MRSWLLTVDGLLVFVVFSWGPCLQITFGTTVRVCLVWVFLKAPFCLQNQDVFVLPKEHPLALPLLKCTSELGV